MPRQPVCTMYGDHHKWVYQPHSGSEHGTGELYDCACGSRALDVWAWDEAQVTLEPDEEAELLEAMPSLRGPVPVFAGYDDPSMPCTVCGNAGCRCVCGTEG